MHNETVTNIYWGVFLIWFGLIAAWLRGDLVATVNHPIFALGTGGLLILLNLTRVLGHLRLSVLTIGLGGLLIVVYAPVVFLGVYLPFLPALIIIAGLALVIGAFRSRNFQV